MISGCLPDFSKDSDGVGVGVGGGRAWAENHWLLKAVTLWLMSLLQIPSVGKELKHRPRCRAAGFMKRVGSA